MLPSPLPSLDASDPLSSYPSTPPPSLSPPLSRRGQLTLSPPSESLLRLLSLDASSLPLSSSPSTRTAHPPFSLSPPFPRRGQLTLLPTSQ
eukprot:247866-Rhodomonas_salina.1